MSRVPVRVRAEDGVMFNKRLYKKGELLILSSKKAKDLVEEKKVYSIENNSTQLGVERRG